ncbi:MAG: antiterminator LoaP [Eggerthellaceae bacterium]|nr:antiterminator LoaP [Eggerthellaceae bacterium]
MAAGWYVIQTMSGQESQVRDMIVRLLDPGLVDEAFLPRYEMLRREKGVWVKRSEVLLPGYVVVVTQDPAKLKTALLRVPRFTRLLGNDDMFTRLDDREVAFINSFVQPGNRTVKMSTGVIEGDEIIVLDGPLKDRTALIKKIDRHKRLAYLDIEMLGRKKTVRVGLEIVAKR